MNSVPASPQKASKTTSNNSGSAHWCWGLAAAAGLAVLAGFWRFNDRTLQCGSDFASFYAAAQLLGARLYDGEALLHIQERLLGCRGEATWYVRLPYVALLFKPFTWMAYATAVRLWLGIGLAAVAAFAWWMPGPKVRTAAICAWSFPLLAAFTYGQDVPVLLAALGATVLLTQRGRMFAAGLALSVLAAKFHLMMLVPAVILGARQWRLAAGWVTGGLVWFALSIAAAGPRWPWLFYETVRRGSTTPHPETMTNLRAIVLGLPGELAIQIGAALVALVVAYQFARRRPMAEALVFAIAAGIFVAGHSYAYDLALALPFALLFLDARQPAMVRWAAWAFVLPVAALTPVPPAWPLGILVIAGSWMVLSDKRNRESAVVALPQAPMKAA